jgi:hypothetical protein
MNMDKKSFLIVPVLLAMSTPIMVARCVSCKEKNEARKSMQDAVAAQLVAAKEQAHNAAKEHAAHHAAHHDASHAADHHAHHKSAEDAERRAQAIEMNDMRSSIKNMMRENIAGAKKVVDPSVMAAMMQSVQDAMAVMSASVKDAVAAKISAAQSKKNPELDRLAAREQRQEADAQADVKKKRCGSCQNAKIRQSIKDALAASLAHKPKPHKPKRNAELDELPSVLNGSACCAACQCNQAVRAPRQGLPDPCITPSNLENNAVCCAKLDDFSEQLEDLSDQLARQGREERKCCSRLREKIDHVKHEVEGLEALIESIIDSTVDCCSLTDAGLSIIDADLSVISADLLSCCSISETGLSIIDADLMSCCSITEAGLSVIDTDLMACCSVLEATIGSVTDPGILPPDIGTDIFDYVNALDLDVIEWLKSLYILSFYGFSCACADGG